MLTANGMRFPIDLILVCIRWQAAYPLSFHHLEEMTEKRDVFVDHSSINRWAIRFLPWLEKVFRKHKLQVGGGWGMDQTCIKVKGDWKYLYRAVNKPRSGYRDFPRSQAPVVDYFFLGDGIFYIGVK
jgi:putative transposase